MYEQTYNPYRKNISIIKDYFKSTSVLVLAILSFASMIVSVISAIVSADLTREILNQTAAFFDAHVRSDGSGHDAVVKISDALHQIAASGTGVSAVAGSVSVFTILTVIGLFLVYFKSRSTDLNSTPSAGVTILFVVAIFSLIGVILLTLAFAAVIALLFIGYAEFTRKPELAFTLRVFGERLTIDATLMLIMAIALSITFAIVAFVSLFFAINRVRYLSSIRSSMNSVELSRKGAKPYGIFCVIAAASSAMSLMSYIPTLLLGQNQLSGELDIVINVDTTLPTVVSAIGAAISLAIIILQAKIALGYAKYIDDKKYGYSEPPAAPSEPFAPANVGVGTSNTQTNPYSYLAQPKTYEKNDDPAFVNPYLDDQKTVPVSTERICPACGAKAEDDAPFCGQCGAKLS